MDPVIRISSQVKELTAYSLLVSEGALFFPIFRSNLNAAFETFFLLSCHNYLFSLRLSIDRYEVKRCGGKIVGGVEWKSSPHGLMNIFSLGWNRSSVWFQVGLGKRVSENGLGHPVPVALIDHARKQSYILKPEYNDHGDVYHEIIHFLNMKKDTLKKKSVVEGFWDREGKTKNLSSSSPKMERQYQSVIREMLHDIFLAKGIDLVSEYEVAGGNVDFLLSANTKEEGRVNICLEIKSAHHANLAHGLQTQLPAYMDGCDASAGIFLVVDFGENYKCSLPRNQLPDLAATDSVESIQWLRPKERTIEVVVFDVSRPIPPSKA